MSATERLVASYVKLVKEGRCTIDQIKPITIRNKVVIALAEETSEN